MTQEGVAIAGAGPAGLAAAIVLARRGRTVTVYERSACVGSRFHDDLQGIENWSTRADALDQLRALGIEPTWWHRPVLRGDLYDDRLRLAQARSSQPLVYLVRRGPQHPDSLDNALLRQALALGVEVRFGEPAAPEAVQIFAAGPRGRPTAVVRGVSLALDHPDVCCMVLSSALAREGYAYFLVAGGHATVAVVMFSHAAEIEARLDQSLAVVERLYGVSLSQTGPRWGGHAQFGWPAAASAGAGLPVGEAAGFQDMLLGFGIRIAMHSGALAARALDGATDYEGAWRRCIAPGMRASQINRAVYNRWRWASRALWAGVGALPDGRQALRCLYGLSPLHRLAVRCLPAGLVDGIGPGGGRA